MPRADIDEEVAAAIGAAGQVLAGRSAGGRAERRGVIGGIGTAPVVPTTFIFGNGTATRTRRSQGD
ncbi:hypothetical protein GE107_14620 [Cohnella sp. CFH 77786]|uniref:hypothetical protein n=1 Tax=Cohnella sp. CFH 77786 TaxID=2662265 RepID=UPI001C60E93B|nr:hypothetical protein [Cohnella sp. CFH 77786]MBW5447287.1 hypothetical protein [Cohnella sp. CFH 77786]